MNSDINFVTYLFLSPQKFIISCYNQQNKSKIFHEEIIIENLSNEINFDLLKNFLEKNIFKIEKNLKNFVEKVNLIIETNEFFTTNVSVKKKNYGETISKKKVIYLLNESKNECRKTIGDRKIIHMLIDNYLIDDNYYSTLPEDTTCHFFSLDIRFICLSNTFIKNIEKTFKNYQILINQILSSEYVKNFSDNNEKDIFKTSSKIIDGFNENEVVLAPKKPKNKGFFEHFFNLFS